MSDARYIEVLERVAGELIYTDEEYDEIHKIAKGVEGEVSSWLERNNLEGEVVIAGSLAKKTMVKGFSDVDIFIRFPTEYDKNLLRESVVSMGNEIFGKDNVRMRFAEHPYIEATYKDITFSLVPSYKVDIYNWKSAVDRSYYHFKYIVNKLIENPGINRDMVLLKAFLRRLGIYGAEVAIKGFSGYLSELLIAKHKSLLKLFREVSRWRPPILIDVEGYYDNNRADAFVMFREPLIVVDPVDKGRNVASAVSKRSLSLFISAVKAFLRKPDIEFFNLSNPRHSYYELSVSKDKPLVGIMVRHFEEVPDILHSQLERVAKKILKALKGYGIECYRWEVFSNYSDKSVIIMNLSGLRASMHYVRQGPYPYMDGEWRFIRKNRDELIWVDRDGRWKIIERRDKVDVKDIIHQALDMINMPTSLNREGVQITVHINDDLKNLDEPEVRKWIENFYLRREFWVDYV